MGEPKLKKMTAEEFFEWHEKQDKKYELVDGVPRLHVKMMTGASRNHDRVTVNALLSLGNQLRGKSCQLCTADIAVSIPAGNYRYPDLLVDCGEGGAKDRFAAEPRIVVEVLSPSTMSFDRILKLEEYKTVASLMTIILVDTSYCQVSVHRREGGCWGYEVLEDMEDVIALPDIGAELALRDLYEGVEFDKGL